MACGAGFHDLAVVSTLIAIIVLAGLLKLAKPLERYANKHKTRHFPNDEDHTGNDRREAGE